MTRTEQCVCVMKIIVMAFKSSDLCDSICLAYSIQLVEWLSVVVSVYSKPQCCDISLFAGLAFMDRLPL